MDENRDLREISEEESPPAGGAPMVETTGVLVAEKVDAVPGDEIEPENGPEEMADRRETGAEETGAAPENGTMLQPERTEESFQPEAGVEAQTAAGPQIGPGEAPYRQGESWERPVGEPPVTGSTQEMQAPGGPVPPAGPGAGSGPIPSPPGYGMPQNPYMQPGIPPQGVRPQGGFGPGSGAGYIPQAPAGGFPPGNPVPYGNGYQAPGRPFVPPAGNVPRPPLPPLPPKPPQKGLSQGAIIGLVITCCITVLLSVLIFTVGMVLKPVFEAASYSMAWGDESQSGNSSNNWYDWYDNYNSSYSYDQESGDTPGDGEEVPVLEHSEDAHNAIEFLISGVMYVTGAEIDEGNDEQKYVIVSLLASNLGTEESGFRLSQITAQDEDGNVLTPVFPAYSYSLGLLPDSVTLKPKYQVRGSVVFPADHVPLTLVIRESDGCEKRSIPIAP